jgi:hypothetical protein
VALLPFDGFSAADLQRMAFRSGAAIGVEEARRWVWMYVRPAVLVVVAAAPLLAAWSGWRAARWPARSASTCAIPISCRCWRG